MLTQTLGIHFAFCESNGADGNFSLDTNGNQFMRATRAYSCSDSLMILFSSHGKFDTICSLAWPRRGAAHSLNAQMGTRSSPFRIFHSNSTRWRIRICDFCGRLNDSISKDVEWYGNRNCLLPNWCLTTVSQTLYAKINGTQSYDYGMANHVITIYANEVENLSFMCFMHRFCHSPG